MLRQGRHFAQMNGEFVVFLIGMRVNRIWACHRWFPVAIAMPRMLAELRRKPELGMLGGEMWGGRTTLMVQYWRSVEDLLAYAKNRDAEHLPAWRAFNRAVGNSMDVGIWHETYIAGPGRYENIYTNMPPFGLGKVGTVVPVGKQSDAATDRFRAGRRE